MSHFTGKVYDLTQENFQKVIAELEEAKESEEAKAREDDREFLAEKLESSYAKIEAADARIRELFSALSELIFTVRDYGDVEGSFVMLMAAEKADETIRGKK